MTLTSRARGLGIALTLCAAACAALLIVFAAHASARSKLIAGTPCHVYATRSGKNYSGGLNCTAPATGTSWKVCFQIKTAGAWHARDCTTGTGPDSGATLIGAPTPNAPIRLRTIGTADGHRATAYSTDYGQGTTTIG